MRLVINALNFSPEIVGNAKYTSELVFWLSKYCEKIIIITTNPYYPEWKCFSNKYKIEKIDEILIYRCPVYIPKKINGFSKIMHYSSFLFTSFPIALFTIKYKPNLIFTICPTIFSIPSTITISYLTKLIFKVRVFTWIHYQDLEIEAAFNLSILRGLWLKKIILFFEKILINQFNVVSTISHGMMEKIKTKLVNCQNLYFLPNFIETKKYIVKYKSKEENPFFNELNLDINNKIIMYSGTLNEKLSYKTLIHAIRTLKGLKDIVWIISGEGPIKNFLIDKLKSFENVHILPFQAIDKLPLWLNIADIHLIPQKISVSNLVLPSKLLGILSSGKPVIGISKKNSDLDLILEKIGISINSEDPELLSNAILKLLKDDNLRSKLGKKGRKYVEKFYEKNNVLNKLVLKINQIIS